MSLSVSDLKIYLTGGVGNTDPDLSIGGSTSTTLVGTALHDLFDHVLPDESVSGKTEYRVIDHQNISGADTGYSPRLFASVVSGADTTIYYAYDSSGGAGLESAYGTSAADIAVLAALTFYSEAALTSYATGLALGGDMAASNKRRIFIKRVTIAGAVRKHPELGRFSITHGG